LRIWQQTFRHFSHVKKSARSLSDKKTAFIHYVWIMREFSWKKNKTINLANIIRIIGFLTTKYKHIPNM
jgi:hypothetical protein